MINIVLNIILVFLNGFIIIMLWFSSLDILTSEVHSKYEKIGVIVMTSILTLTGILLNLQLLSVVPSCK